MSDQSPHQPFQVHPRDVPPASGERLARAIGDGASQRITAIGNISLLTEPALGLFCSAQCPGQLVLDTYDLAQALRDSGTTVISGFHSPMEQECLKLLLRGKQPIIICPARSIDAYRMPSEWRPHLESGRLLMLSPFEPELKRVTTDLAQRRNRFVAAVADEVFIAYAAPDSSTERFACSLAAAAKSMHTLPDSRNQGLLDLGASHLNAARVRKSITDDALDDAQLPLFSPQK